MPRAITCILGKGVISVEDALRMRDDPTRKRNVLLDFRCIECGMQVRPHKDGKTMAAHFEHHKRNAACPLSDPSRG